MRQGNKQRSACRVLAVRVILYGKGTKGVVLKNVARLPRFLGLILAAKTVRARTNEAIFNSVREPERCWQPYASAAVAASPLWRASDIRAFLCSSNKSLRRNTRAVAASEQKRPFVRVCKAGRRTPGCYMQFSLVSSLRVPMSPAPQQKRTTARRSLLNGLNEKEK